MKSMESYVNCPECLELVPVVMKPYHEAVSGLMESIERQMGVGKTNHYQGEVKCRCGKMITASLHVTAMGGRQCR